MLDLFFIFFLFIINIIVVHMSFPQLQAYWITSLNFSTSLHYVALQTRTSVHSLQFGKLK